jgi:ceramide glucosyltransferase
LDLTALALVQVVTLLGTVSSLGFYVLCGLGISSFVKTRRLSANQPSSHDLPPVSILKPLKGTDPEMWENFCSHCEQEYPEFQIVFGVSEGQDPAVELVRRLQKTYPQHPIDLVVCERNLGANTKMSNLAQMLPAARHELLIVNDSDIRVPPDYLQHVLKPLAEASIGLVTCLYRGVARKTLGSRLEALGICADFVPGVVSARYLEKGLHFGLGSTLAFRRSDLARIGGF